MMRQGKKEVTMSTGCQSVSNFDTCEEIRAAFGGTSTLYALQRTTASCAGTSRIVCVSDVSNQECINSNSAYTNYLTCPGSGGVQCSNPTANDGQYTCVSGYVYKCNNGDWDGDYICGHTGETGNCKYGDNVVKNIGGSSLCEICSCTSWQEGGCGTNGCSSNAKSRIRTCTPNGCDVDLECYSDVSCEETCTDSDNGQNEFIAGYVAKGTSYYRDVIATSSSIREYYCDSYGVVQWTEKTCTYGTNTVTCPTIGGNCAKCLQCSCGSWSSWANVGCGQGSCSSTQMQQRRTRTCTPAGCNTETEYQCYTDTSCTPICTPGQTKDCYCDDNFADPGYDRWCTICHSGGQWLEFSAKVSCPGGTICNNGICILSGPTYSDFLSYKSSYLSEGSLSSFISSANQWIEPSLILKSGMEIEDYGGGKCTIGMIVKKSSVNYILTAGHCNTKGSDGLPDKPDDIGLEVKYNGQLIGHVYDFDDTGAIDAALISIEPGINSLYYQDYYGIQISGFANPTNGMNVYKYGKTTGLTYGTISDTNIFYLDKSGNLIRGFKVTGSSGEFSTVGDSGSAIITTDTHKIIGILSAGSGSNWGLDIKDVLGID